MISTRKIGFSKNVKKRYDLSLIDHPRKITRGSRENYCFYTYVWNLARDLAWTVT